MGQDHSIIYQETMYALQSLGNRAEEYLVNGLKEPNTNIRRSIITILSSLKNPQPETIEQLIDIAINDKDNGCRVDATIALSMFGSSDKNKLITAMILPELNEAIKNGNKNADSRHNGNTSS